MALCLFIPDLNFPIAQRGGGGVVMDGPQTYLLAQTLSQQLCGAPIDHLAVPPGRWQANVLLMNCTGQVIQRIYSCGKWLIFDFSHGISWACCLLARSHWDLQPTLPENTAPPPFNRSHSSRAPLLSVHLRSGTTAFLRGRPLFLTLTTETLWQHSELKDLGPDPLHRWNSTLSEPLDLEPPPHFAEKLTARLRQNPQRTLAAALLDQQIVVGLANHLKCEILFDLKLHPSTRVGALYASHLDRVPASVLRITRQYTRQLLSAQSAHQPPEPEFQVFDRADEVCPACGQTITVDRSGADGRWSWYCPACQLTPATATLF